MEDKKPVTNTASAPTSMVAADPKAVMAKAAAQRNAAQATDNDEGESQSQFLNPNEGGAYTRNADGSLTRTSKPTQVPETMPIDEDYRRAIESQPVRPIAPAATPVVYEADELNAPQTTKE